MHLSLFDYELPSSFVAQQPAEPRDSSRLLVLERATGQITHRHFRDVGDYLRMGDRLVANDSRVIPARLLGRKATGGAVELFLLRPLAAVGVEWEVLIRGKVHPGTVLGDWEPAGAQLDASLPVLTAEVTALGELVRTVRFSSPIWPYLDLLGSVPLPPYITGYVGDPERYQTVYSRPEGSVAAPTAGLHFTPELLLALRAQGVDFDTVTLHVGLDTFKPVEVEEIERHPIHTEAAAIDAGSARRINDTTLAGGRIVAVGTTATRTLEWGATGAQGIDPYDHGACPWQRVAAFDGPVNLFIYPGYRFRAVDALITNFHLPRSSLLMLVSAFIAQAYPGDVDAGRRILLESYEAAKRAGYRFFSFGDAMLIL